MKMHQSRIKKLLQAGQLPTVLKINFSEPRVIEIAALCGIDSVWLCTEHVPNDWIGLENQIRAARIYGIDTLVRVGRGSYSDYIRPLEAGATGIIVPHVANADEARQIVEWLRFHPLGKRALDGGNVDGQFCQIPITDYVRNSNEERLVILQIESPEALEQVEAIAAVPGFDGLLFGPGDFKHRLGKLGQTDVPELVRARKRVATVARAHGKFAMTAGLIAPLAELVADGYNLINVGADVVLLANGIKQRLTSVQKNMDELPAPLKQSALSPYA
jgi:4-hydroxy-2-oxoheptanedioate aldolase